MSTSKTNLTRQEMFDRAYIGLRSQGWVQCVNHNGVCVYSNGAGRHCAWGWVDLSLTTQSGSVTYLRERGIGLAALLSMGQAEFADELQKMHDGADDYASMEERFRHFALKFGLTIPTAEGM